MFNQPQGFGFGVLVVGCLGSVGFRVQGFKFGVQVQGLGFRVSCFELRVQCLGFKVGHLGFKEVQGLNFRKSNQSLGFRVQESQGLGFILYEVQGLALETAFTVNLQFFTFGWLAFFNSSQWFLEFTVSGLIKVQHSGFNSDLGFRVQGLRFRVKGLRFTVQGLGLVSAPPQQHCPVPLIPDQSKL